MKKFNVLLLVAVMVCACVVPVQALDWGSMLGGIMKGGAGTDTTSDSGSNASSLLGDILGGVLQKDDLEVADIAGTWVVSGPSIQFKSDDLLGQAGGAAAASN